MQGFQTQDSSLQKVGETSKESLHADSSVKTRVGATAGMRNALTGAPGGALGGVGGATFGSGLTSLSSTSNPSFSPNMQAWVARSEEDAAVATERRACYRELSNRRLETTAAKAATAAARKAAADRKFEERQRRLAEDHRADKARQRQARADALAKPTLGDVSLPSTLRQQMDAVCDMHTWLWPMQKAAPLRLHGSVHASSTRHAEYASVSARSATTLSMPHNASAEAVNAQVDNLVHTSQTLRAQAACTREHRVNEERAAEAQAKMERERAASARRAQLVTKKEAAEAARVALSRRIKQEMADTTRREAAKRAEAAQRRFYTAEAQRKEVSMCAKASPRPPPTDCHPQTVPLCVRTLWRHRTCAD